ncbi:MAG: PIN domain-containing protein [Candidatus Competibacteraceae bacterium]
MTDRLFVDTLFIVALVNRRDQYHRQALDLADQYDEWPLLTTDAVLLEVGNALARNHKQEAVAIIERLLAAVEIEIVRMTPDLFARAFVVYKQYQDKSWGLVDCLSFVAMREAKVNRALTFDRHFVQAGFECLMRE